MTYLCVTGRFFGVADAPAACASCCPFAPRTHFLLFFDIFENTAEKSGQPCTDAQIRGHAVPAMHRCTDTGYNTVACKAAKHHSAPIIPAEAR